MYSRWLIDRAEINSGMLLRIDETAARRTEEAVTYAEALPFPKPETATERLFAPSPHDPKPADRRGVLEPIESPAIPELTAARDKATGGHF